MIQSPRCWMRRSFHLLLLSHSMSSRSQSPQKRHADHQALQLQPKLYLCNVLQLRHGPLRDLQLQCFQDVPYLPLGAYNQPFAYRRSITGMLNSFPVFYNIRKA